MSARSDFNAGFHRTSKLAAAVSTAGLLGGCVLSQSVPVPLDILGAAFTSATVGVIGCLQSHNDFVEYVSGVTPEEDTTHKNVMSGLAAGALTPVISGVGASLLVRML